MYIQLKFFILIEFMLIAGCILIFLSIKTDESSQDTTETTETTKSKSTAVEFYRPITEKSILEQVLSK